MNSHFQLIFSVLASAIILIMLFMEFPAAARLHHRLPHQHATRDVVTRPHIAPGVPGGTAAAAAAAPQGLPPRKRKRKAAAGHPPRPTSLHASAFRLVGPAAWCREHPENPRCQQMAGHASYGLAARQALRTLRAQAERAAPAAPDGGGARGGGDCSERPWCSAAHAKACGPPTTPACNDVMKAMQDWNDGGGHAGHASCSKTPGSSYCEDIRNYLDCVEGGGGRPVRGPRPMIAAFTHGRGWRRSSASTICATPGRARTTASTATTTTDTTRVMATVTTTTTTITTTTAAAITIGIKRG